MTKNELQKILIRTKANVISIEDALNLIWGRKFEETLNFAIQPVGNFQYVYRNGEMWAGPFDTVQGAQEWLDYTKEQGWF